MKLLLILLLSGAMPAQGRAADKNCPEFSISSDPTAWRWMDRDCKIRTRQDLEKILENHRLWLDKYRIEIQSAARVDRPLPDRILRDPFRADLAGAHLANADLAKAVLYYADLSGAVLSDAVLTGAHLAYVDMTGDVLEGARLNGADLEKASLTRARLIGADVSGADLAYADLTEAHLEVADLAGANLFDADATGAELSGAELAGAVLEHAALARADLSDANLTRANLSNADLTGADISTANLTGADLSKADLTGADLRSAHLWSSNLVATNLGGADLTGAQVWNAVFAPTTIPLVSGIARAEGLRTLRWNKAPQSPSTKPLRARLGNWFGDRTATGDRIPMEDLRKALHDAGYLDAEQGVNLAYHRMEQSWWQEVVFDWTSEWGASWRRPLEIVGGLAVFFSAVYWALLRFTRRNRLYVIGKKGKREQRLRVGRRSTPPGWFDAPGVQRWLRWFGSPGRRMRWEIGLYWTAVLFSLMSVLNLGVQGLDPGRWVRLLHRRDFDLEARGMIRAIAGVQSLLSLGLLTLAALAVLGHPIE